MLRDSRCVPFPPSTPPLPADRSVLLLLMNIILLNRLPFVQIMESSKLNALDTEYEYKLILSVMSTISPLRYHLLFSTMMTMSEVRVFVSQTSRHSTATMMIKNPKDVQRSEEVGSPSFEIYLNHLPAAVEAETLIRKMSKFGEVKNGKVLKSRNGSTTAGFITYYRGEDADHTCTMAVVDEIRQEYESEYITIIREKKSSEIGKGKGRGWFNEGQNTPYTAERAYPGVGNDEHTKEQLIGKGPLGIRLKALNDARGQYEERLDQVVKEHAAELREISRDTEIERNKVDSDTQKL